MSNQIKLKRGSRVRWQYYHTLNSRSGLWREKVGTYHGPIKHTHRYDGPQLASVSFDGNKWSSRVPLHELRQEEAPDDQPHTGVAG